MIFHVKKTNNSMNQHHVPTHVAVIPDGNRRWAKSKGLPFFEGHRTGADKTLPALIEKAGELGIQYFTFWVLSTENLAKRSPDEVNHLYKLMRYFIQIKLNEMHKKGARILMIGNLQTLPEDIQKGISQAVEKTKDNKKITVIFAVNYGGRDEILRAIKKMQKSNPVDKNLDKDTFSSFMDTAGIPDPDLIIRTGGDKRISGFMLWQSEYSEIEFLDMFFPDFTPELFEKSINDFSNRQRRFGK
jgi:undecaprenyl diphosphate synthase